MNSLEYLFAALILALIVSFGVSIGTGSLNLTSQKVTQTKLEAKADQVLDTILLTTGSPPDWGSLGGTPDSLGLAPKGIIKPYILDGDKVRKIMNGSISIPDVRRLLSLGSDYDITIVLRRTINMSISQINSKTYKIILTDWKGYRVPNALIDGYYFDSSWSPGGSFEHIQKVTGINGSVTLSFSNAVSRPLLVAGASLAGAGIKQQLPYSSPYFDIVGERPYKIGYNPILKDGSTFSTQQGGLTLVTSFRTVIIGGNTYELIFTFASRS